MNKKMLVLLVLFATLTGCVTIVDCDGEGHRLLGSECMKCGQHAPWMVSNDR
jgi:hypothetical protein